MKYVFKRRVLYKLFNSLSTKYVLAILTLFLMSEFEKKYVNKSLNPN